LDLVGESPYIGLGGQIRDKGHHLDAMIVLDRTRGGVGASGVAAGDRNLCTHRGQSKRGCLADAAGATGDKDGVAGHGALHYEM
jgi:hypothetical protein